MKQHEVGDYLIKKSKDATPFSFVEISGIWKNSPSNNVNVRIKAKRKQISKKVTTKLELFTIVTEFGEPIAKIIKNELG